MKVKFAWLDKKGKTPWRYRFHFNRYWSGKIWSFGFWKWDISLDFRKGNLITWLYDDMIKRKWFNILKSRKN